jgi:hypothetical protein
VQRPWKTGQRRSASESIPSWQRNRGYLGISSILNMTAESRPGLVSPNEPDRRRCQLISAKATSSDRAVSFAPG